MMLVVVRCFFEGRGAKQILGAVAPRAPYSYVPATAHSSASSCKRTVVWLCAWGFAGATDRETFITQNIDFVFIINRFYFVYCHLTNKAAYLLSCKLYRYWVVYSYWRFESIRCDSVIASWQGRGREVNGGEEEEKEERWYEREGEGRKKDRKRGQEKRRDVGKRNGKNIGVRANFF